MRRFPLIQCAALSCVALSVPTLLAAQDSLRVLRVDPRDPARPDAPIVVTFDHPVAPLLDVSIDAARLVRIEPAIAATASWRDPSTIVVSPNAPLAAGRSYEVIVSAPPRALTHLPFAGPARTTIRIAPPRLLLVANDGKFEYRRDPIVGALAVYSAPPDTALLRGRAWLVPRSACGVVDSIPMRVAAVVPLDSTMSWTVREAGGWNRDHRGDAWRRAVTLVATRSVDRGCRAEIRLPGPVDSSSARNRSEVVVLPRFRVRAIAGGRSDRSGPLLIEFTTPVRPSDVAAHVRVDGRPARPMNSSDASAIQLFDSLHARRSTRIEVDALMRDNADEPIARDTAVVLTGPSEPSMVGYAHGLVLVPRDASTLLRVRFVNTDSVRVAIVRVTGPQGDSLLRGVGRWDSRPPAGRDSLVRTVPVHAEPDVGGILDVPMSWVPASWGDDDIFLLHASPVLSPRPAGTVRGARSITTYAAIHAEDAVVQRSDLALHALAQPGWLEVWATALRDGRVAAGVPVQVLDETGMVLARATTGALGRATLDLANVPYRLHRDAPLILEAIDGVHRTRLLTTARIAPPVDEDTLTFWQPRDRRAVDGSWLHGAAFSERGIYRPGEMVHLGGVARRGLMGSYRIAAGDSARWSIGSRDAHYAIDRVAIHAGRLDAFGTLPDSFALPRTARLGDYVARLTVRDGADWRLAAETWFRVGEYRAPEFSVVASADTTATLYDGDTATATVRGRYLYDAPMPGATVRWWTTFSPAQPWETSLSVLDGYTVGRYAWRDASTQPEAQEGSLVLGAAGVATLRVPVRTSAAGGRFGMQFQVSDANRQTVVAFTEVHVNGASAVIGLRTREPGWLWPVGRDIPLRLLVVRPDGTVRRGDPVRLIALRSWWADGSMRQDTVWRSTVESGATAVEVAFLPPGGGSYEIVAATRDERGRVATTGLDLWVAGAVAPRDPRALTLHPDREHYAPGDSARVVILAPVRQRAWVSLRGEGTLFETFADLDAGANVVTIPLTRAASPRADLNVVGVRGYGMGEGADSAGIYLFQGSTTLDVQDSTRVLRVAIEPDSVRHRPGDRVTVHLEVRDAQGRGRRAAVTVWGVDEGVLALTDYSRPELLPSLLASTLRTAWTGSSLFAWMATSPPPVSEVLGRIQLRGYESRLQASVATAMDAPMSAAGNGAVNVITARLRSRFATTAFYDGTVRTDERGRADATFTLPDNVTRYRLYAVALADDAFTGSGDSSVVSTTPLIVRAALPRVVRTGDSLYAGAVVTQDRTVRTPVALAISATGATLGGGALRDTLDGRRARELRTPIHITAFDSVRFEMRATSGSDGDAVAVTLAVSPPGRARARVATGVLRDRVDLALPLDEGSDVDHSRATLQLGMSAFPLVSEYARVLRIYPYECTEQVSSAGRALLARIRLANAVRGTRVLSEDERTQLERGVAILVGRQREDGGIGYWGAKHWSSPWLTAYALDFMRGARDVGVDVPGHTIARATAYLSSSSRKARPRVTGDSWAAHLDSLAWPHDALAAASLLRRAGAPDSALEREVEQLAASLGFEDRLVLATLRADRGDAGGARDLLRDAWRSARLAGRRVELDDSTAASGWLFRSIARPYALLLTTTARIDPADPRLGALFESVVQLGRGDRARWWNTLDMAAVADALTAGTTVLAGEVRRVVSIGSPRGAPRTVALERNHADTTDLPVRTLLASARADSVHLALSATGPGATYFALTLFDMPSSRPVRADDEGIAVERWYERYDDGRPTVEAREGELVRVRLRITVPADREFVVIDDALPAGLEAVDLSLRTSAALPPSAGAPRRDSDAEAGPFGQRYLYGSWDAGWWTPWEHKEIRDDRVLWFARQLWKGRYDATYVARATTAGVFIRPPAQAEEMYNPAVRGRSDGGVFTVRSTQR